MSDTRETTRDRDRDRQSDLAVMDVDEYKQKRRLERILDAQDHVEEIHDYGLEAAHVHQDIRPEGVNILLLEAVQELIRELVNPLRTHAAKVDGRDRYWKGKRENPLGKVKFEHGPDIEFVGLHDILSARYTYTREYEEQVKRRNMPPKTEVKKESHTVPKRISWSAYLVVREFADKQLDLDLSYEDSQRDQDHVTPDY